MSTNELRNKRKLDQEEFDSHDFVPAAYNKTYYSTVMQDEAALINWQAGELDKIIRDHLNRLSIKQYPKLFDAGTGPSIHHLLSFAPYAKELHLAEYMPENLDEIRRWVARHPKSHNWNLFTQKILEAERKVASSAAIAGRQRMVRNRIASYYAPLDLKEAVPSELIGIAPIVTSFFVADSATRSKNVFARMTKNAFETVSEGGIFIASYLGGCEGYRVGRKWLPCADIEEDDIRVAFNGAGARNVRVWRFDTPEMKHDGFDHIYAVVAEK